MIDSPDFTHRVAKRIRRLAPELETRRATSRRRSGRRAPERAKKMADVFRPRALPAAVRSAVLRRCRPEGDVRRPSGRRARAAGRAWRRRFARATGIGADERILALLPGSRLNEIRFLWPVFRAAIERTEAADRPACDRHADGAQRRRARAQTRRGMATSGHRGRRPEGEIRGLRSGRRGACGIGHGLDGTCVVRDADGHRLSGRRADGGDRRAINPRRRTSRSST